MSRAEVPPFDISDAARSEQAANEVTAHAYSMEEGHILKGFHHEVQFAWLRSGQQYHRSQSSSSKLIARMPRRKLHDDFGSRFCSPPGRERHTVVLFYFTNAVPAHLLAVLTNIIKFKPL